MFWILKYWISTEQGSFSLVKRNSVLKALFFGRIKLRKFRDFWSILRKFVPANCRKFAKFTKFNFSKNLELFESRKIVLLAL